MDKQKMLTADQIAALKRILVKLDTNQLTEVKSYVNGLLQVDKVKEIK